MIPQETQQAISKVAAGQAAGFHRWNDAQAKSYRTYIVGAQSQVLLITKAYRSANSRNQAQKKLRAQRPDFVTEKIDDQFYYTLRNEKNKLLAAGPPFDEEAERDEAMEALLAFWPKPVEPDKPAADTSEVTNTPALRHSFRIDFYPDEDQGGLRGRITYPITESKMSFQGVNAQAIAGFIQKHLDEQMPKIKPSVIQAQSIDIVPTDKSIHNPGGHLLISGRTYRLQIGTSLAKEQPYDAVVTAKSLEDGEQQIIGRHSGVVAQTPLQIRLLTEELPPGLYRFTASVSTRKGKDSSAIEEGSKILQVL